MQKHCIDIERAYRVSRIQKFKCVEIGITNVSNTFRNVSKPLIKN